MPEIDTGQVTLRTLAEAATPGPWQVVTYRTPFAVTRYDGTTCSGEHVGRDIATVRHHPQSHAPVPIVTLGIGVTQETPVPFVFIRPEDADYLAAVSPEVVLALLDTIDALRASLAAAEKERDEALRDAIKFTQKVDAGIVRDEEYLRLHREKMEQYDRRVAAEARAEKAEAERDAEKAIASTLRGHLAEQREVRRVLANLITRLENKLAVAEEGACPPCDPADPFASGGVAAIAAERRRQTEVEGWTIEHDDAHGRHDMPRAAACYAWAASLGDDVRELMGHCDEWNTMPVFRALWPWDRKWWKPTGRRRDLVKAGALIAAEIDRLDRAALAVQEADRG